MSIRLISDSSKVTENVFNFIKEHGYYPSEPYYYKLNGPVLVPGHIKDYAVPKKEFLFELENIDNRDEPKRTNDILNAKHELADEFEKLNLSYYEACIDLAVYRRDMANHLPCNGDKIFTAMSLLFNSLVFNLARQKFLAGLPTQQSLFG